MAVTMPNHRENQIGIDPQLQTAIVNSYLMNTVILPCYNYVLPDINTIAGKAISSNLVHNSKWSAIHVLADYNISILICTHQIISPCYYTRYWMIMAYKDCIFILKSGYRLHTNYNDNSAYYKKTSIYSNNMEVWSCPLMYWYTRSVTIPYY